MISAILAGGKGSRMGFEAPTTPKPLADIGGEPILWHLVKYFHHYGFSEVWIAIGARGNELADHFAGYAAANSDFEVFLPERADEPAPIGRPLVRLIDTGEDTSTGGRIRQLTDRIGAPFLLSWCDGLADIDLNALVDFHRSHGKPATLTAVHPPGRFGHLTLSADRVKDFVEKPSQTDEWINGSFFVLNPDWKQWNANPEFEWERDCLAPMAKDGALMAYRHAGFWQCMDTSKERDLLNALWQSGNPPWKKWD